MKLIVDGSKLKEAVNGIKNGLGSGKVNLLYETIGLWTDGENLVLETQDDITKMNAVIPCQVDEHGSFRCSGSVFINLVGHLGGDAVELQDKDETLTIKQNNAKVKVKQVQGFVAKDTDGEKLFDTEIEIDGAKLFDAINRALVCVSKNDARLLLRCINFAKCGDQMRVSSLDGFRVSRYFVPLQGDFAEFNVSMPTKAVSSILTLCDTNEKVTMKIGATRIAFIGENGAIYSGLYEGQFYAVDKNFPTSSKYVFKTDLKELKRAVGLSSITVDTNFNTMELEFNMGTKELGVSSQKENAESTTVIPFETETDQPDITIAVNAQYVNEILKVLKDETVVLELMDDKKPIVIRSPESENSFLLLPIRRI